ncbi:MAG: RNA-binding protein [Pirellulaceae bacterium]|jgi:RNA recognition motif-containing protein|nr:RNA-binding protein [Pirellulaceae bacterium]MDG2469297.1 RNA-binding protein [Pirellulaceae bacterium]
MNIFVGNLAYEVSDDDLREAFESYGVVSSASVLQDRETGRSRGFGFVEMANDEEARNAMEKLNLQKIHGRAIQVNEARPREERPRRGGGSGRRR